MKARLTVFVLLCSVILLSAVSDQPAKADKVIGTYYVYKHETKSESRVQIYKAANGTYEGKIVWLKNPTYADGTPKMDKNNPDPKLRTVKSIGLVLVKGFKYDAKADEWIDGKIYDPDEGKTYSCKLKFETDTKLRVRGYIGVPALGKTMIWEKKS
jgi:uncharacterized protein (DUF2147 family)